MFVCHSSHPLIHCKLNLSNAILHQITLSIVRFNIYFYFFFFLYIVVLSNKEMSCNRTGFSPVKNPHNFYSSNKHLILSIIFQHLSHILLPILLVTLLLRTTISYLSTSAQVKFVFASNFQNNLGTRPPYTLVNILPFKCCSTNSLKLLAQNAYFKWDDLKCPFHGTIQFSLVEKLYTSSFHDHQ